MNTMMKAEIASERIRSRSHTPKAGRRRTAEGDCGAPDRGSSVCLFSDPVVGVSGMRLFYCIQIASFRQRCLDRPNCAAGPGELAECSNWNILKWRNLFGVNC